MMNETVDYLKKHIPFVPRFAIILGTGLGALSDEVVDKIEIPYEDIPGFVKSTAPSHHGVLIAGKLNSDFGIGMWNVGNIYRFLYLKVDFIFMKGIICRRWFILYVLLGCLGWSICLLLMQQVL